MKARLCRPLDAEKKQIRLLQFRPGSGLSFTLESFELDEAPAYYALSYTWGPANPGENILVNDRSFRVRVNLLQFLRKLTNEDVPRRIRVSKRKDPLFVWVDQICINQSNLEERGEQVRLMADIYKRAEEVLVWLGNEEQDLTEPVRLMGLVAERFARVTVLHRQWIYEDKDVFDEYNAQQKLCKSELRAEGLQPILSVFSRPYWSRLWTLQEFVLANKLVMLFDSFYLNGAAMQDIYRAASPSDREELFGAADKFFKIRFHDNNDWQPPIFHSAIMSSARLRCFDPRDRIFGILGFVTDASAQAIIDYSKPGAEVFWDTFHLLKPLHGVSWELNNADLIYELGLAMGVTGNEEGARSASVVRHCKQFFGGKTPQKVFGPKSNPKGRASSTY